MAAVGAYQYAWPSIRTPLQEVLRTSTLSLSTVFTVFIVFQSLSQFPIGWLRDNRGPKIPLIIGIILGTLGFLGVAYFNSLPALYIFYSIGGIGNGAVYTVAINTSVKWFKEKRGLASGIIAMAYGGGSFLIIPAVSSIDYKTALVGLSVLVFIPTVIAFFIIRDPDKGYIERSEKKDSERLELDSKSDSGSKSKSEKSSKDTEKNPYSWKETLFTWQFWLLYFIFTVVNGIGLMLVDKIIGFASNLGLSQAVAISAASLIALAEGIGRPIWGGVSDRIGREKTTSLVLVLCAISLYGAVLAGEAGLEIGFILAIFLSSFFRTPIFAIFPSMIGDYYGAGTSSQNYAMLYSGKMVGGVFGGTITALFITSMGWNNTFFLGAFLTLISGLIALLLKPP